MMGILLILVIAIILAKWIGTRRNHEQDKTIRFFLLLLVFAAALLIPLFFWKTLMKHGMIDCGSGQPFVSFLISSLLFAFFLCHCCDHDGLCHHGKTTKSTGPILQDIDPSDRDELKKIEGIGPKIQKLLYNSGIYTFEQLAEVDHVYIKEILTNAGDNFRHHDPVTRPLQAKMAYEGKWTQLGKRQDELKGGRL